MISLSFEGESSWLSIGLENQESVGTSIGSVKSGKSHRIL